MMQSADRREHDDVALRRWLKRPNLRGIFVQPQMGNGAYIRSKAHSHNCLQT